MVDKVADAITTQLAATFGDGYHYYLEDVEQNLKRPCFTIYALQSRERSRSAVLYDRTVPIIVHYFSDKTSGVRKNAYQVAETIMDCLEYLPFDGSYLRGENISYMMVDEVLEVFITYRFRTQKVLTPETNMEELENTDVSALPNT